MQLQLGSGKTAVLVERIINKIIKDKIDIDKILLVTFTNAAASEMRERILNAIYKKIEEEPESKELQRQIILLPKANICTIHSFCLDVIKNNFYEIDISPNFRIGEETELEILKYDVIEEIFDNKYESKDKKFLKLIECYTSYKDDENLKQLILRIYKYIQSSPYPEKWLEDQVEKFNYKNRMEEDFSKNQWGDILLKYIKEIVKSQINNLLTIKKDLAKFPELDKFYKTICTDIIMLEKISNIKLWNDMYINVTNLEFEKWPTDKKCVSDLKDKAKEIRDKVKAEVKKIKENLLLYDSKDANKDLNEMYMILSNLKDTVLEFSARFSLEKRKRNIIDFNDIEHLALKILENEDIVKKYKEKFIEIAIDEYQDSNLVQEKILTRISNGSNIFMVGDVKQSIYRFRQARPDLFLTKYENYSFIEEKNEKTEGVKIQLFKNFRSMSNILDITNMIFDNIMSKEFGEIDYNNEEFLNICEEYKKISTENEKKSELDIINLCECGLDNDTESEDTEEQIENTVLEAKFVANRIKKLLQSDYKVYDKKVGYRNLKYKDIVILLRSTSIQAPIYEKEIGKLNLPVFSDSSNQYLDTIEIQTIMSLLKIIDNPMQDIPLVTVLRSVIGGFSDDELIEIRIGNYNMCFYDAMLKYKENKNENKIIKDKIIKILNLLEKFRQKNNYLPLHELIWEIYLDTGYYNYVTLMPNGIVRQANLKLLFEKAKKYENANFKGLFNFINFIDKLKISNGDMGSAKLIGENEDVIRIMSIHKSKGLEFPIVFLSGTGKQFNMQDLNENILLHQDIGLGPKYVNYERKIEYNTLAKEAIKIKMKEETISEEMRILYVALTRAKEKLIITGISKDFNKEINNKKDMLKIYENNKNNKINSNIISKCKSYLDWMELVYLNNEKRLNRILELNIYDKKEILENQDTNNKLQVDNLIKKIENMYIENKEKEKKINSLLDWKYEYIDFSNIQTKSSVTKIKQMQENYIKENKEIELLGVPKFLQEEVKITNAQIGTLMHLCLNKMNVNVDYTIEKIEELTRKLHEAEIITKNEMESINVKKLYEFTKSNLWQEMRQAKKIYKEQAFYINIPVNDIYKDVTKTDDKLLVQGIIDLYYIDKNSNLTLVDYKTDYVKEGEEYKLIERYSKQLELYKYALENSLNKKVHKVVIYSIYLNKEIYL